MKAWDLFRLKIQLKYSADFVNEPLWYNPKCNTGELLIQNWFRNGVRNVRDLHNGKGQVLNFQEVKEKYNVKGTLLDYERVLRCIPNEWLNKVDMVEEYTPRIEKALKTLLSCVKGTRLLYDVLISCNNILPSQQRWEVI